jgi:hypothetical protein
MAAVAVCKAIEETSNEKRQMQYSFVIGRRAMVCGAIEQHRQRLWISTKNTI